MIRITHKNQDGARRTTAARDGKDAAVIVKNALDRQWYESLKSKETKAA